MQARSTTDDRIRVDWSEADSRFRAEWIFADRFEFAYPTSWNGFKVIKQACQ